MINDLFGGFGPIMSRRRKIKEQDHYSLGDEQKGLTEFVDEGQNPKKS
jgi:hypothetical protein